MPYIPKEDRAALDAAIDQLADRIVERSKKDPHDPAFAGLLNYCCTRLTLSVLHKRFGKIRYWMIAAVTGVFKNASDEFYRRIGVLYENKKIDTDGDVDLYSEYEKEITG